MSTIADVKTNSILSNDRTISATSTDSELTGISFYVDSELLYTDNVAPYEYVLYTNDYDNGEHIIRVQSTRISGGPTGTNYTVQFSNNFDYAFIAGALIGIIVLVWIRKIFLGNKMVRGIGK